MTNILTKNQALLYLRTWPRWFPPSDDWVRRCLVKTGLANQTDSVSTSYKLTNSVPYSERQMLSAIRRLAKTAEARSTGAFLFTAWCGEGRVERRVIRVVIKLDSEFADDDLYLRLDYGNADALRALAKMDGLFEGTKTFSKE